MNTLMKSVSFVLYNHCVIYIFNIFGFNLTTIQDQFIVTSLSIIYFLSFLLKRPRLLISEKLLGNFSHIFGANTTKEFKYAVFF